MFQFLQRFWWARLEKGHTQAKKLNNNTRIIMVGSSYEIKSEVYVYKPGNLVVKARDSDY